MCPSPIPNAPPLRLLAIGHRLFSRPASCRPVLPQSAKISDPILRVPPQLSYPLCVNGRVMQLIPHAATRRGGHTAGTKLNPRSITPGTHRTGRAGRTRQPLERMNKIFALLQDGKYPNCSTLAAALEVSTKTVKRDLESMRDGWQLPIEYDSRRFGYYFTQPVERFPGVAVTEKELFELCVVQKLIDQYQGTPLQKRLELFLARFMRHLDHQERFTLQSLDEVLSFRPFAPDDADLRLFEIITGAVRERRAIEFQYRKPGEKNADVRRVHPYHLMQFNNRWYLLGLDQDRGEIRKFVPGRMRDARLTDETFARPSDFDPKQHFNASFGVMTGAGDYEVVIELDPWLADVLRGRRWHRSQVWTDLPGGGCHLQLRLSCLEEIEQWVLSWGTRATVLRPQALAERVAQTARELAARYAR